MSRKSPKPQAEDPDAVAARARQVLDRAELDDEENRRIKQMRSVSRGTRAFRAVRGAAGRASSAPGVASVGGGSSFAGDAGEAQMQSLLHFMSPGN
jgi:mevalonate pyrophosphate decarboxylase